MRILVADDDRVSRMTLGRWLGELGHEVALAEDGEKAWNLLVEREFDVVLSDWMMPNLEGPRLCGRIRRRGKQCGGSYIYVVLLTARDDRESMLEGFKAGADDFLTKPVDNAQLLARLRVGERVIALQQQLAAQVRGLDEANRKLHRDLEAAARVQRGKLPEAPPPSAHARFGWLLMPCEELAGDFLNVVPLGDEKFAIYVLDVSGHGVAAALLSLSVSQILSAEDRASLLLEDDPSPREILRLLNERFPLREETGMRFFTIVLGILDARRGTFRFASAGHPPPLVCRADRTAEFVDVAGPAVGWMEVLDVEERVVDLGPGDMIVLYSDGIVETLCRDGEQFGQERLASVAACHAATGTPGHLIDVLVNEARTWNHAATFEDDITLVAFGLKPA